MQRLNKYKDQLEATITSILVEEGDDLVFAYIFGSFLTDYYQVGRSDIDLGIYFRGEKDIFQINELAYRIQKALTGHPEVDIVQMQQKKLIVNHEIFKKGKLLIDRDKSFHEQFLLSQWSQYIDFKISRRKLEASLVNPILKENKP